MWRSMPANDTPKEILIVDRDVAEVEPLRQKLQEAGFVAVAVSDASLALSTLTVRTPHLAVVDWHTLGPAAPDFVSCVRGARSPRRIRLIILSAPSTEFDVVTALNLGADDFISKPFSLREAVARVVAILRSPTQDHRLSVIGCDELALDVAANRVTAAGRVLNLRGAEYRLLEILMSHAGRTFNRAQLIAEVWGVDKGIDERTVDVHVQRLRKILCEPGYGAHIQTVRGFGYRFAHPSDAHSSTSSHK
jgi:two-component system phosphate regulon response regulator PhoB